MCELRSVDHVHTRLRGHDVSLIAEVIDKAEKLSPLVRELGWRGKVIGGMWEWRMVFKILRQWGGLISSAVRREFTQFKEKRIE